MKNIWKWLAIITSAILLAIVLTMFIVSTGLLRGG